MHQEEKNVHNENGQLWTTVDPTWHGQLASLGNMNTSKHALIFWPSIERSVKRRVCWKCTATTLPLICKISIIRLSVAQWSPEKEYQNTDERYPHLPLTTAWYTNGDNGPLALINAPYTWIRIAETHIEDTHRRLSTASSNIDKRITVQRLSKSLGVLVNVKTWFREKVLSDYLVRDDGDSYST